ncbi:MULTISPECIES: type V toxin-antitoxin system endoribonuclease antitoxin GhoS [Enterobacteriaceae]|jgi:dihydrodipicolinate synthase/N-acetylneuraminate lyase|uniref:type V toxin-antitoxin system endoribonuclease antitoxin GhoS n=1 Tax=Enterobacteriaceae TaxID=543 RepID=UPI001E2B4174|nr:type V toxin-antitoxin system endoribonuclease antitoxin GhoS [Lelliottia sp. WAP21]
MSSGDITRYVVTVKFHEDSLTELNEMINHLTRAGFSLTMADDDGNIHDLGTNTFGLISALSPEEVKELAQGLTKAATGKEAEIEIAQWEEWRKKEQ